MDPTRIRVADVNDTCMCPFAMYVRKRLRKKGIVKGLLTVFSDEPPPRESLMYTDGSNFKKSAYGTISYIPAAFGGACASVVLRGLVGEKIVLHKNIYIFSIKIIIITISLYSIYLSITYYCTLLVQI